MCIRTELSVPVHLCCQYWTIQHVMCKFYRHERTCQFCIVAKSYAR